MTIVALKYRGHNVTIKPPSRGLAGKYTISIGRLVTAYPLVKRIDKRHLRVFWDRDYGTRFNRLLQGAFNQFYKEVRS